MSTEIKTWEIIYGELKPINTTLAENGKNEREDLEKWIKTNPKILGENIVIIGEQVQTKSGLLDYLGIDIDGNMIIIELKRNKLPRDVITQAIDYASDVANWELDKLGEVCLKYSELSLEDLISENFENIKLEDLVINSNQRILLVGFGIDEPLNRMIEWLSSNYDLAINAIILSYVKTSSNNELLSRTVIIPEEIEQQKTSKKKFKIPMSDDPGNYDEEELKELLENYLCLNQYSAKRIKNIVLPALLKKDVMTRIELKKEFVNSGEEENKVGYYIALISNQLGQAKNDFLRQVINYEYPNYSWEKDNFKINGSYKKLIEELLIKLKS